MQQDMNYDPIELRNRYVQRYGSDLGELAFDAETNRRRLQDDQHAAMGNELTVVEQQISQLCEAAGNERSKSQAALATHFAAYLAHCAEAAEADSLAQAQIAPLRARSLELQMEMRTIVKPRLTDRDIANFALLNARKSNNITSARN